MDSNISNNRPWWLTNEEVAKMRRRLKECPNPYTDEEALALEADDPNFDIIRSNAHTALKILTKYGIPLTEEE